MTHGTPAPSTTTQVMHSEATPLPPLCEYRGAYDVFKRRSEEVLNDACDRHGLGVGHLRVGAIFSNDQGACIQASAHT